MHKCKLIPIIAAITLAGCHANQAEPYDKSKSPENRKEYSGLKGANQYVKDTIYRQEKELNDKCEAAKIDLITATANNDIERANDLKLFIAQNCQ